MTPPSTSPLALDLVDYARELGIAGFGAGTVMARIAAGELAGRVPLLDVSSPPPASGSRRLDRGALAEALVAINAEAGNPLPGRLVESIRRDAVFVIAGQQPGLLGGPMLSLLKAVSAIRVARRLGEVCGVPAIPAFWIAGEDHDLAEANRCWLGGRRLVLPHAELNRPGPRPPLARVSLMPFREDVLRFVRETLGGTRHGAEVADLVASVRFDNYSALCADLMAKLLGPHGLILVDPMHLRGLAAPVLADATARWGELQRAFERGRVAMGDLGLAAPIDRLHLFLLDPAGRQGIDAPEGLGPAILADPSRYSPGAALRPIVQDAILPTVATIGGPTEMQYLWQIAPLYPVLGVTRSATWPRAGATFVDVETAERAALFGLRGPAVLDVRARAADLESLPAAGDDDLRGIEAAGGDLLRRLDGLLQRQDSAPVRKARESIGFQVRRVVERVGQERAGQGGLGKRSLQRVLDAMFPGGEAQERRFSPLELLAKCGSGSIDWLVASLDPASIRHHLIWEGVRRG